MDDSLRQRRFVMDAQNPDGGWGYFPGRASWLEPTAWAALALHGSEASERAYRLVRGWQSEDGRTRPAAHVDSAHWSAALVVILAAVRGDTAVVRRGARYLLGTTGADSATLQRFMYFLSPAGRDRNPAYEGWPWRAGASAWIEPTAHSITALSLAAPFLTGEASAVSERIASAQDMIWHQRCHDGGWNYGARTALGVSLQSFPETTALALIGLLGRGGLEKAFAAGREHVIRNESRLSRAWLALCFRLHGQVEPVMAPVDTGNEVLLNAVTALAAGDGQWRLLTGGKERA